jgi:DNA-3-methyladenine glycosylase I
MKKYHDIQWGKPCHDERELFEMLVLEGMQAGLSWSCVLNKRENFRLAFDNFDVQKVAEYKDEKISELMQNSGIIRNKRKILSAIAAAQAVLKLSSLSDFIWNFVDGKPIVNYPKTQEEIPTRTDLSDKISEEMKKLGFSFVGSVIIYSYLQAIGVVNDHIADCDFKF